MPFKFAIIVFLSLLSVERASALAILNIIPKIMLAPDDQPQVWKVTFEGNQQLSDNELQEQIFTKGANFWGKMKFWNQAGGEFDEIEIKKDVIRLERYYQQRGFVNVKVNYRIEGGEKDWKKDVIFELEENDPVIIRKLDYKIESNPIDEKEIRESRDFKIADQQNAFKVGNRYEPAKETEVEDLYTDALKKMGFAYAEVNILAITDTVRLASDLTIICKTGPQTFIDSIEVEGVKSISESYVKKEAALDPGEIYSPQKIQKAQEELVNHHLFRFATVDIPEQTKDSTLNIRYRVRENKKRKIEVLGGFGIEEKLVGQVTWTDRNVLQMGHKFTVSGRASFIEQYLNLEYLFPYAVNTKGSVLISPFGQHLIQTNYELLRAGITNSFIYQHNRNITSTASYEYTVNREEYQRVDASLPDSTFNYDLSTLRFSTYYNQGVERQKEGWFVQPYVEIAGLFNLASLKYQKIGLDVRRFSRLGASTMLAARMQAGNIFKVEADSLPRNVRIYLGGTNSVRGWTRQELGPKEARVNNGNFIEYIPVGGRSGFAFNLELRQDVDSFFKGFGIAVFLDGGQVWEQEVDLGSRPIQFSTGGGVRYQSPIGPIRLDIGYKINPTDADLNKFGGQDFGNVWDRIAIHFSIGQAF